jgi:hypothetical protein
MQIHINNTDVTAWFKSGTLSIVDPFNQPTTLRVTFLAIGPGGVVMPLIPAGGETITVVRDNGEIQFDGVIPYEGGVGSLYYNIQATAGQRDIEVQATDYQTVLDWQNCPDRTFYDEADGEIVRTLIRDSAIGGFVDVGQVEDGLTQAEYSVSGRKFSQVVRDRTSPSGFFFRIYTRALAPARELAAEFRGVSGNPAPFSIDRFARGYHVDSLRFDPPDRPLLNQVTIVGDEVPAEDLTVDVFEADGNTANWVLTRRPFHARASAVAVADFDSAQQPTINSGAATVSNGYLVLDGIGGCWFNRRTKLRDLRYSVWEDVLLGNSGCSVIFGLWASAPSPGGLADCIHGVWFKPGGDIAIVVQGEEVEAYGAPKWVAEDSYQVRVKQTSAGTLAEVNNERLAPVRHWFPLRRAADRAAGVVSLLGPAVAGDEIYWSQGGRVYPTYRVTAEDAADLLALNRGVAGHLNGLIDWSRDYLALTEINAAIVGITSGAPAVITLNRVIPGLDTGGRLRIDSSATAEINGEFTVTRVSDTEWSLDDSDTTTSPTASPDGTAHFDVPAIQIEARSEGSRYNAVVTVGSSSPAWATAEGEISGGTDPGEALGSLGSPPYTGLWNQAGTTSLTRMQVRDPVGMDVRLERAADVRVVSSDDAIRSSQSLTFLTVAAPDETGAGFSCQFRMDGEQPTLGFFDDDESLPRDGDVLRIAYYASEELRVKISDTASVERVKAASQIPGDTGIREGLEVNVQGRVSTREAAQRYAAAFIASRSGRTLNGQVKTSTLLTGGAIPRSGQSIPVSIPIDGLSDTALISSVTTTYEGIVYTARQRMELWSSTVSFGRVPDEFLLPADNPAPAKSLAVTQYDVAHVSDQLKLDEDIEITL